MVDILTGARSDGLEPQDYGVDEIKAAVVAAQSGQTQALARAELLLSQGYSAYVRDLHQPRGRPDMLFVDPELVPASPDRRRLLAEAAAAPSLARHLEAVRRMNPLYEGLRNGLAGLRARGADPDRERVILANIERARALPADPGRRFILVDTAGARLWMFENGRATDSMKVVVGKNGMQTPEMAALVRFAVVNPYWNIPPDLVRDKVAPRVLGGDAGYLQRERLELLSDFSPNPRVLTPEEVDWRAVASGARRLRVRQLPGGDNMMGAVKFMFPNRLGIYLHDTPDGHLFAAADRRRSSGCVRVEDARRLSRWLFGRDVTAGASGTPEQRVDLPQPVPVYITYLTAVPRDGGIAFQRDVYGRDHALLRVSRRTAQRARSSGAPARGRLRRRAGAGFG